MKPPRNELEKKLQNRFYHLCAVSPINAEIIVINIVRVTDRIALGKYIYMHSNEEVKPEDIDKVKFHKAFSLLCYEQNLIWSPESF